MKHIGLILFGIALILFGIFWMVLLQLGGNSDFLYMLGAICAIAGIIICLVSVLALCSSSKKHEEEKKGDFITDSEHSSHNTNNI